MAEFLVPKIIDQLSDVLMKQFAEKIKLVEGVEEEVANISSKLATIERVLHDAEGRRLKEKSVGIWLEKFEDITYEMDDVLDIWNFKIHRAKDRQEITHQKARSLQQLTLWSKVRSFIPSLCSCLKQVPVRSDIALKIKGINEKLELTLKEADQFNFVSSAGIPDSYDFRRVITTSIIDETEVYGRASDKDNLLDQIFFESSSQGREGVQVISIVGVGGSGKTTLAQLLYNDYRVKNHFELTKWVCVSDPFDEIRIAKAILESPCKSSLDSLQLESLLQLMKETFSNKRFLLVLDDVWTEKDSKWKPFKDTLKNGAPGSVILVTTRSLRVARVVETTHTHHMAILSDSDCWQIMQRISFAGRSHEWCKNVERIGLKIAEKCKGLPLAAKTMGSLLRFKDTVQQWQNVLDSEIWQLEEVAIDLFPHLYLSYNELSPELKRCFSYCAVFPKDQVIKVDELIMQWIAHGYIRSNRRGERLEMVGLEYFNNLAMRSFFQEIKKYDAWDDHMQCKMHDIVHDFAKFLTKNECLSLDGVDYEHGTGFNSFSERVRHLTLLGMTGEPFNSPVLDFGRLRSFFLANGRVVPHDLFHHLACVRTLTLSDCQLREVPTEVGNLIHLRYLNLSANIFEALPEAICDLYYLETFDVDYCGNLSRLPERMDGLLHLRHLLNHGTYPLLHMPQGLGKLTSLCSLTHFVARSDYDDLAILKHLNQLERLDIHIRGDVDFRSAELGKKIYMREMSLEFFHTTSGWVETCTILELPPNLQQLELACFPGTQLPSWFLTTLSLTKNLTKLSIKSCKFRSFPILWNLASLECLTLCDMEKLKYLSKEFFGITAKTLHDDDENSHGVSNFGTTSSKSESSSSSFTKETVAFPNLRVLNFEFLGNWTHWEDSNEDDEVVLSIMPLLEELHIMSCHKLETLPHRLLGKMASLKTLVLLYCYKLEECYSNDGWMKLSHIPRIEISH